MLKESVKLLYILLIPICLTDVGHGAWKKRYDTIEFTFSWRNGDFLSDIRFRIPLETVLKSYNKIKPVEGTNAQKIKIMEELYVHDHKERTIRLELERFVEEDSEPLKPLATALMVSSPDKSKRGLAKHALSFVQSIPYGTVFKTRTTSLTPIGVLIENRGDCDSKSSLLVSILKGMGIDSLLLDIPSHMMVGIDIPIEDHEAYFLDESGKKWVVAETTIEGLPMGVWDKKHFGKPAKAIPPYRPKPPKIEQ
jgi:hypothetical protein